MGTFPCTRIRALGGLRRKSEVKSIGDKKSSKARFKHFQRVYSGRARGGRAKVVQLMGGRCNALCTSSRTTRRKGKDTTSKKPFDDTLEGS